MSIITLGESLNIDAGNKIDVSKNLTLDNEKNMTFSLGTIVKIKNNVYFPNRNNIYIGNTSTTLSTFLGGTVPAGCIIIWAGTIIPSGWASCDGTNGTPNLKDLFIIGTDPSHTVTNTEYPLNNQRGNINNQILLSANNLPQHSHTGTTSEGGSEHTHGYILCGRGGDSKAFGVAASYLDANSRSYGIDEENHYHSLTSTATGSSNPILNILPPYYALIYIMKL